MVNLDKFRFDPKSFTLYTESCAVYYSKQDGRPRLLLVAPNRPMAEKLAFDLASFYHVPLRALPERGPIGDPEEGKGE